MRTRCRTALLATALAALTGPSLLAQGTDSLRSPMSWQLQWENDSFALLSGSDEHYTNGVRINWLRNPLARENPRWAAGFAERWCSRTPLCGIESPPSVVYGHGVGENFYTPEDISAPQLIVTDRPYAGYFYYSTLLLLRNDTERLPDDWEKNQPVQNHFELQLGIVGPEAAGEQLQSWAHEVIDDEQPQGWANQLKLEPTLQFIYVWRRKQGNTRLDFIPHWGLGLGTVMTYAAAGGTVRLGRNLSDFPEMVIMPTVSPPALNVARTEYYLFLGAEGRGVVHNIFLDGNVFGGDSHSVDKESFVYDLKAGFAFRRKEWRLTYTFTRRSEEFSPNFDDDPHHDYGSISLTRSIWTPGP
ncbi:MAG: lipid A deacylase LpxR family protein [Thermoanaerobaculia bacterium]